MGAGRYGTVRACTRKVDGAKFACKTISSAQGAREAAMEVEVLEMLRGQAGVVQLETVFRQRPRAGPRRSLRGPALAKSGKGCDGTGSQGSTEAEEVQIVMQRCYGGTLADRLQERGPFAEAEARQILQSVLHAVALLHSHGYIYRDIKDTNFLFAKKEAKSDVVAIDFGLAARYTEGETLSEVAGSPLYIAPEVVKRAYGPQCDVWSAGVLFYQLLCGWHPFQRDSLTAVLRAITTDGVLDLESGPWAAVSESSKHLLRSMLTRDADARPTAAELLQRLRRDHTSSAWSNKDSSQQ